MSIMPKPNSVGRIVVEMSAPHLPSDRGYVNGTSYIALNADIDPKKFPSTGVSTLHVLKQLHALGPNCFFLKTGLSRCLKAYQNKRPGSDQCVSFLGKIFYKGALTFGASSGPSIFNRLSEIQVFACLRSSMR